MKPITFLITAILICIFSASAFAQTLDLPEYTTEQRWERAAQLVTMFYVLLIRQEMETGKTAEEVGQTLATILGPSWSGVTSPALMARAMHRNLLIWPGAEFEAEEAPDGSVSIRVNRPDQDIYGESGILYDVSIKDVETVWHVFRKIIAQQQGMEYHQVEDDGWFMIKISSK